jgi:hypothetical protein
VAQNDDDARSQMRGLILGGGVGERAEGEVRIQAEQAALVRCHGCRRRFDDRGGFSFGRTVYVGVDPNQGVPLAQVQQIAACVRDDCDFADRCKAESDWCRRVQVKYLDEMREQKKADAAEE